MNNNNQIKILPLIDLTSLNFDDDNSSITILCQKALTVTPQIATVCIFSKFIPLAKKILANTNIKITTVANFPDGNSDIRVVLSEIQRAIDLGANEIDVVIPYRHYFSDSTLNVIEFTQQCANMCKNKIILKTILETGVLQQKKLIEKACADVLAGKTQFIKTSTGKIAVGATTEAVAIILNVIKHYGGAAGIKISGGINTIDQANSYLSLIEKDMPPNWINPTTVRFGTSKLLDDVLTKRF